LWAVCLSLCVLVTTVACSDLDPDFWSEIAWSAIPFLLACVGAVVHCPRWVWWVGSAVAVAFAVFRIHTLWADWEDELNEDISHGNCGNDPNYNTRTVLSRIFQITNVCLLDALFFIFDTLGCVAAMGSAILFLYMNSNDNTAPTHDDDGLYTKMSEHVTESNNDDHHHQVV